MTAIAQQSRLRTFQLDTDHTRVEFAVRHMMIATVKGYFAAFSGTVRMDPEDPTSARIDVTIDASSLTTGVAARDEHLRSPDFLDVANHPVIKYRSHRVEKLPEGLYRVHGDLVIRDLARPVPLLVEHTGDATDASGVRRSGFSATARFDRRDYGLTWNVALEAGGVLVGDEVRVSIEAELVEAED